ncbi:MAG: T9SS type A sorting domain-containing protein, partial [Chitinophagales bacterium]|nr:T9SS type A sorting domain-containing protein [Chitinophagales bacterium]
KDFIFSNKPVIVPPGYRKDTFSFELFDNNDYEFGKKMTFKLINISDASFITADTVLTLHILSDDVFQISFVGAGRTIVEKDTTVFIRVACNGVYDSATTARVKLDAGSAIKGKHFRFNDTVVTIPAFSRDTVWIPVTIIDDTLVENTREANFTLMDVSNSAVLNIRGFTLTIRDNDLLPSKISDDVNNWLSLYPNPASNTVYISSSEDFIQIEVYASDGKLFYSTNNVNTQSLHINIADWPCGLYYFQIISEANIRGAKLIIQR